MTAISNNSAALTILTHNSFFAEQNTSGNPADNILNIVSARAASNSATTSAVASAATASASERTADTPRAVGGSVSSGISKATMSAMSVASVNSLNYGNPVIAFTPVQASVENAEVLIRRALGAIDVYNSRLEDAMGVPAREEYNARYAQWGADRIANGEEVEKVNREVAYFTSDKLYQKAVDYSALQGSRVVRAGEFVSFANDQLSEIFGTRFSVTYDEQGEGKIESVDMYYASGRKMLSYADDGSLTTYNEDGSVRSSYSAEDALLIEV